MSDDIVDDIVDEDGFKVMLKKPQKALKAPKKYEFVKICDRVAPVTTVQPDMTKPIRTQQRRLSPAEWKGLEMRYVNSSITLKELSEASGVSVRNLSNRCLMNKWKEKRAAMMAGVESEATSIIRAERIDEVKSFNLEDLEIAKAIRDQVKGEIKEGDLSVGDLRTLASTAETAQRIGRLALGMNTQGTALTGKDGAPIEYAQVSPEQMEAALVAVRDKF